jgi:hypothetical protein
MARHLEACRQKLGAQGVVPVQQIQKMKTLHLVVEGEHMPRYWLHLEVATSATLEMLDQLLRDIWLECCGHLSAFTIDGMRYCRDEEMGDLRGWLVGKQAMQATVGEVMRLGQISSYEYDFGSTTALRVKVIATREVEPGKALRILARNVLPPVPCDLCDQPATRMCLRCRYGSDEYERAWEERDEAGIEEREPEDRGYLCATCAAMHPCRKAELRPLRRVNSPRAGVCGYNGPTNPLFL